MPHCGRYGLGQDTSAQPVSMIPVQNPDGSITWQAAEIAGEVMGTWARRNWPWLALGLAGLILLREISD